MSNLDKAYSMTQGSDNFTPHADSVYQSGFESDIMNTISIKGHKHGFDPKDKLFQAKGPILGENRRSNDVWRICKSPVGKKPKFWDFWGYACCKTWWYK